MPPARALLYCANLGVLLFLALAVLAHPPSLGVSVAVSAAYVALILTGVLRLQLRMFTDALTEGPRGARGVALTFDDGPHPVFTPRVLDLLDVAGVRATFFVIARKAETYPQIIAEILRRGHEV